ncbi:DNA polymerase III subunit delta [Bacillus marasmi]|uniref:DNA polymerase III subunit delta n=1 Tax=Bacillus marasmi TaxID=1926279 RepID=UPI0011C7F2F7|nr:DNA polymerase III subunit delta [Bacillus marasmi]
MIFELWKQIRKKQIAPVYLLFGAETFFINETKQLLMKHVLEEDESDFNLSSYDLEETPIEVVLEDAETLPFLGERRLIFLHNPVFLTAEKTKEKVEHNLARLEAYLKEPAPFSVLVFTAPYEKLDERKKITKELKRTAALFEAKKLSQTELKQWIFERAESQQVQITDAAAERMIELVGANLFMLVGEMDKLTLYATESKFIDEHLVEKLVSKSLEQNIFTLIDKIVNRNVEGALRIYYDLLKQNEEPLKILAMIVGQFRLIYQVKELARRGYGQQQMATFLKVHPYRVKLAAGQARSFSDEELTHMMRMLADADYQMKTGGMNKEMLIEMFLLQLNTRK